MHAQRTGDRISSALPRDYTRHVPDAQDPMQGGPADATQRQARAMDCLDSHGRGVTLATVRARDATNSSVSAFDLLQEVLSKPSDARGSILTQALREQLVPSQLG